MIHYQLHCADGHDFEGWFRDSAAFDDQARRGLLSCPQCGAVKVGRALMAPAIRSGRSKDDQAALRARQAALPSEPASTSEVSSTPVLPDELRAALQRLRAEVERHCDDVGDGFAEAARRRHGRDEPGETPPRGIYGQVTDAEREALVDEGIEITRIPWLPRAES